MTATGTSYTTLADLVTKVRRRSDQENGTFVTDADIEDYIQESYYDLYDLLVEADVDRHLVQDHSFSTVAGQAAYTLENDDGDPAGPLDIYKLLGAYVSRTNSADDLEQIRHTGPRSLLRNLGDRYGWGSGEIRYTLTTTFNYSGDGRQYRVMTFDRTPDGVYGVALLYVPTPRPLDDSSPVETFLHYAHWDTYIVCDAAAKVLEKEESDASHLYRRLEQLRERIRWHAATMDANSPRTVRDIGLESYSLRGEPREPF